MGFGMLFVGYYMCYLMSYNPVGFALRLLGYILVSVALVKLSGYHKSFKYTAISTVPLLLTSVVGAVYEVGGFLYDRLLIDKMPIDGELYSAIMDINNLFIFVFHAFLLFAVKKIAGEVGELRICQNAVRNFVFICIYLVLCCVPMLPFAKETEFARYFSFPTLILYLVCVVLNLILLFSCYSKICDEGDVDMPLKRSRFEFVNKFREETARREQKAADESVEYYRRRAEEKRLKKLNRKKKK